MGWKATGRPAVRRQRERWVVRVDGIDTETGAKRPRQLGTYPSRRAAHAAALEAAASGSATTVRGTVGWLVDRWVASRTDVGPKTKVQYVWAAGHIGRELGAIPLEHFDRDDVARWLDDLATGGRFSRRSVQILRMVLRASFADALDEGLVARNPAARVALPREVNKAGQFREVDAWSHEELARFLDSIADHRWEGPIHLLAMFGLRRSELLALKWDDLDFTDATVRIDEGLVEVRGVATWTSGKNARSRRTIPIDPATVAKLRAHRVLQAGERMLAGSRWHDEGLVVASQIGRAANPRNFAQTIDRLVAHADVPRLTSKGLRHTAATHMVKNAADAGELRAIADVLGHSPDMLMRTYAHALPQSGTVSSCV